MAQRTLEPITPTLAAINTSVAAGVSFGASVRAALKTLAELATDKRLTSDAMAYALRLRPGLLHAAATGVSAFPDERPAVRAEVDADARVLLVFLARQIEAAFRDDVRAIKWLAGLVPARSDKREGRKGHSKQGRPCPLTDDELIAAYNQYANWCAEVLRRVRTLRDGRPLPLARDARTRAAFRRSEGDQRLALRRERRRKDLRELSRVLKVVDPALANVKLLGEVVTGPRKAATRLAVEALHKRARGFNLASKMAKAITDRRKHPHVFTFEVKKRGRRKRLPLSVAFVVDPRK